MTEKLFNLLKEYNKKNSKKSYIFQKIREIFENEPKLIEARDKNGQISLHIAAASGNIEILQLIIKTIENKIYIKLDNPINNIEENILIIDPVVKEKCRILDIKSENGQTALHLATLGNHVKIVEILLENHANINIQDENLGTCLHYATKNNDINIVIIKTLIYKGADVNLKDKLGQTPLYGAIFAKNIEKILFLMKNGADLNLQDKKLYTLLHYAVFYELINIVEILVKNTVNLNNIQDETGASPLHYAAQNGHELILKCLINHGAKINLRNHCGQTPLYITIPNKNITTIQFLIENCADVNLQDNNKHTILHCAAFYGATEIVRILVENIADLDIQNINGKTALHHAIKNGHIEIVQILIEQGANTDLIDNEGKNILDYAEEKIYTQIIKILKENNKKNSEINKELDKSYLLFSAISKKDMNLIKYLIRKITNSDILKIGVGNIINQAIENNLPEIAQFFIQKIAVSDIQDINIFLNCVIQHGYTKIAQSLIEKNIDVNFLDKNYYTHLDYAGFYGNIKIIRLLVENGAKIGMNLAGLYYAIRNNNIEIVQFFLGQGIDINIKDINGITPLIFAVGHGYIEMVEFLITNQADINQTDNNGKTPLHIAVEINNIEIIDVLAKNGANIYQLDNNGKTPLNFATETNNIKLAIFILNLHASMKYSNNKCNIALNNVNNNTGNEENSRVENVELNQIQTNPNLPYKSITTRISNSEKSL